MTVTSLALTFCATYTRTRIGALENFETTVVEHLLLEFIMTHLYAITCWQRVLLQLRIHTYCVVRGFSRVASDDAPPGAPLAVTTFGRPGGAP